MEYRLEQVRQSAVLMRENLAVLQDKFPLEAARLREIGALLTALQETALQREEVAAEYRRLRGSTLRLKRNVPDRNLLAALLLLSVEERSAAAQQAIHRYLVLRQEGFAEDYLFLTCLWLTIRLGTEAEEQTREKACRLRALYRAAHISLPAGEEECYLQWLSCLPNPAEELTTRLEQQYDGLKDIVFSPALRLCLAAERTVLKDETSPGPDKTRGEEQVMRLLLPAGEETEILIAAAEKELCATGTLAPFYRKKQRREYAAALAAGASIGGASSGRGIAASIALTRYLITATSHQ